MANECKYVEPTSKYKITNKLRKVPPWTQKSLVFLPRHSVCLLLNRSNPFICYATYIRFLWNKYSLPSYLCFPLFRFAISNKCP